MATGIKIPPVRNNVTACKIVCELKSGKLPVIDPPITQNTKVKRHRLTDKMMITITFDIYICVFERGIVRISFHVLFLCSSKNNVVAINPSEIGKKSPVKFLKASV